MAQLDALAEYTQKVFSGEIIAGVEIKKVLRMLQRDRESGKYIFDPSVANMRIAFIQTFCKQSKAPFYNKPPVLMLWQKAFFTALYSFFRKDENGEKGKMRFTKALMLIARKNGKTALAAFDGFTEMTIGEGGQFLCCGSNDDKQAALIWGEVKNISKKFEKTPRRFHSNLTLVKNNKNDNEVFKMSSRTRDKDGRQISKAYLDEIHNARDNELYMSIWQSMSITEAPLLLMLTTEGFITDGLLDKELIYGRGILDGEIDDDTFLPFLFTQDSENEVWQSPETWVKSNPSLGTIKKWDYLQANVNKAKRDKETRMHVLCKDFNIHQNNSQAFLMQEDYTYPAMFDIADLRGCYCLAGVDLSSTTDMTAAIMIIQKPEDNTVYMLPRFWIPERKLTETPDKNSGAKYEEWARAGLLEVCPGNEVDGALVADWLYTFYENYNIMLYKCGYDVRLSKAFTNRMTELFGAESLEVIPQAAKFLSEPTKLLEADLKSRNINYNENELMRWCFSNCQVKLDPYGRIIITKIGGQAARRIDGAAAAVIAYAIKRMYQNEYMGLYS